VDAFAAGSGQVLADVVGSDRQFSVSSVSDAGELHACRSAVRKECFDRGPCRAPRVHDVVNEDAGGTLQLKVKFRCLDDRLNDRGRSIGLHVQVVTMKRDVNSSEIWLDLGELTDQATQALRYRHPSGMYPNERYAGKIGVSLNDLVGDARDGASQRFSVQQGLTD
jgi:hypothetical protein